MESDYSDDENEESGEFASRFKNHFFSVLNVDGDAFRVAEEALADIKYNIGKCLHSADLCIAIAPWLSELLSYLNCYGNMLPQEDFVHIVELVYHILSTPGVDYDVLLTTIHIGRSIFKSEHHLRKIHFGQLSFAWRPLYENLKRISKHCRKSTAGKQLSNVELHYLESLCQDLSCFFSEECVHEIWLELRVGLDIYHENSYHFTLFETFFPYVAYYHRFALSTWIPYVFQQLTLPIPLEKLSPAVWLLTNKVNLFCTRMDLSPYLGLFMDFVMRSLPFDIWPKKLSDVHRTRMNIGVKVCRILTASILASHENTFDQVSGMPQTPLACVVAIIRRVKPFLHSQLKDDHLKVASVTMLEQIAFVLHSKRSHLYESRRHVSFLGDIHISEYDVRQEQVDLIAEELFACFKVFMYHRDCDKLMVALARLRPSLVVPEMLQEFYLALETVYQTPDRLLQNLKMWIKVVPYWAVLCSSPDTANFVPLEPAKYTVERVVEWKKALLLFLDNLLPLVTVENFRISSLALPVIIELGTWFPFTNWSEDPSVKEEQLSEDELELLAMTVKFDDCVVDLINRMKDFFTSTSNDTISSRFIQIVTESPNMYAFRNQLSTQLCEKICRSLADFYLEEMLSITSPNLLLFLINLFSDKEFADALMRYYLPIVLDRLETHIKEHHLHYHGKADSTVKGLLNFISIVNPHKLPLFQDRLLDIIRRLMQETEPSICKLVGKLLGSVILHCYLMQLSLPTLPDTIGWFRNTWNIFSAKKIFFSKVEYVPRKQESMELGDCLLREFVFADVVRLEQLITGEEHAQCHDTVMHAVISRLAESLIRLKDFLEQPMSKEDLLHDENPYAPRKKKLLLSYLSDRLMKPLTFPDGTPVLQHIMGSLLILWRSIRDSEWNIPLREITLRQILRLETILLVKAAHRTIPFFPISRRTELALSCRGLTNLQTFNSRISACVFRSMMSDLPLQLSEEVKELVNCWIFSLIHSHPPITSFAHESLSSLLLSSHPSVLQFILKCASQELSADSSSQWTEEQMKRVVKCLDPIHRQLSHQNLWILCDYVDVISELLRHPVVNRSHEITYSLSKFMQVEVLSRLICKSLTTVDEVRNSSLNAKLAQIFLPRQSQEDLILITKTRVEERLKWCQNALSSLLQKTNNLQQANSHSIAAHLFRYLCGLCEEDLLHDHVLACLTILQYKQKSLSKWALAPVVCLLRKMKPKPHADTFEEENDKFDENCLKSRDPWNYHNLFPRFVLHDSCDFVLSNVKEYESFVRISTVKSLEGYRFKSSPQVRKLPLQRNQLFPSGGQSEEYGALIFNVFSQDSVWESLEDMLKSDLIGKSTGLIHQLKYLFSSLLDVYGCQFLPRLLKFFSYLVDEMERNSAFYGSVGILLHTVACKTRFLPFEERVQCVREVVEWLLQPDLGTASCWLMLKWDLKSSIQYLPFYQYLSTRTSSSSHTVKANDLSTTKDALLTHFFYYHSVCDWRACRELPHVIRQLDEFLFTQQDDLFSVEQRDVIFRAYARRFKLLEGSRWRWEPSSQPQNTTQWLQQAIIPALAYYVAILLARANAPLTAEMKELSMKWPLYLEKAHHFMFPTVDASGITAPHAQYTIRQLLHLFNACGPQHESYWQIYILLSDLLPLVSLYPVLDEAVNTFMKSKQMHLSSPSDMFTAEIASLSILKTHASWSCKKMFLSSLSRVLQTYARCFFSPHYRHEILSWTVSLMHDGNESVRQTAKSILGSLLRAGFIAVQENLQSHISSLERQLRKKSCKEIKEKATNSQVILEWVLVAIHGSIVSAYSNELLPFLSLSLVALARGTSSKDHAISQMAKHDLANFKHCNSFIWPRLIEIMSADDFSFVNECALSGANYYV